MSVFFFANFPSFLSATINPAVPPLPLPAALSQHDCALARPSDSVLTRPSPQNPYRFSIADWASRSCRTQRPLFFAPHVRFLPLGALGGWRPRNPFPPRPPPLFSSPLLFFCYGSSRRKLFRAMNTSNLRFCLRRRMRDTFFAVSGPSLHGCVFQLLEPDGVSLRFGPPPPRCASYVSPAPTVPSFPLTSHDSVGLRPK